jgi:hypothetical protein
MQNILSPHLAVSPYQQHNMRFSIVVFSPAEPGSKGPCDNIAHGYKLHAPASVVSDLACYYSAPSEADCVRCTPVLCYLSKLRGLSYDELWSFESDCVVYDIM